MALMDFLDAIPEDKRESFKQEIQNFVNVKEIDKHPEFQRQLSIKHETTMAKWEKEKLPLVIEEEVKKRSTKQPWEIEIENMKNELAQTKRQALLKEREANAVGELSKLGINPQLAKLVLHEDESIYSDNLKLLAEGVKTLVDGKVKQVKTEVFSQKPEGNRQSEQVKQIARSAFDQMDHAQRASVMKSGAEIVEG